MSVNSLSFLAFAAFLAAAYNLRRALGWRQTVLFIANLAFLATFVSDPLALVPLGAFLAAGYAGVYVTARGIPGWAHAALIGGLIVLFCWIKQYIFMPGTGLLAFSYTTIGMSYVLFRLLHLVIDAASDDVVRGIGPIGYLNYLLNFTCLVSGPIQRWQDFAAQQQAAERPVLDSVIMGTALRRIVVGLFKTVVLSAFLADLQGDAAALLSQPADTIHRAAAAAAATGLYTIYLYLDFSGYCDIVIGIGRFFRLELPENFNQPFQADNFLDFWSRWHMTLTDWFKTYLYNPVLKVVLTRYPTPGNEPVIATGMFFFTFFLIGLWHGQTAAFIAYGLLLGFGAASNRLWQFGLQSRLGRRGYRDLAGKRLYSEVARGLTFTWLSISLVCFWMPGAQMSDMPAWLGPAGVATFIPASVLLWIVGINLTTVMLKWLGVRPYGDVVSVPAPKRLYQAAAYAVMLFGVVLLSKSGLKPFIYAQF